MPRPSSMGERARTSHPWSRAAGSHTSNSSSLTNERRPRTTGGSITKRGDTARIVRLPADGTIWGSTAHDGDVADPSATTRSGNMFARGCVHVGEKECLEGDLPPGVGSDDEAASVGSGLPPVPPSLANLGDDVWKYKIALLATRCILACLRSECGLPGSLTEQYGQRSKQTVEQPAARDDAVLPNKGTGEANAVCFRRKDDLHRKIAFALPSPSSPTKRRHEVSSHQNISVTGNRRGVVMTGKRKRRLKLSMSSCGQGGVPASERKGTQATNTEGRGEQSTGCGSAWRIKHRANGKETRSHSPDQHSELRPKVPFMNKRRVCGPKDSAVHVYDELVRVGAVARVPELLVTSCPLLQELGVYLLACGFERVGKTKTSPDTRCEAIVTRQIPSPAWVRVQGTPSRVHVSGSATRAEWLAILKELSLPRFGCGRRHARAAIPSRPRSYRKGVYCVGSK